MRVNIGLHQGELDLEAGEVEPGSYGTFREPGAGVYGWSDAGYGGVFSSDKRAAINLVPAVLNDPPAEGKAGDLIVLGMYNARTGTGGEPQLWLCVLDGNSDKPALWKQVTLARKAVPGK